MVRWLPATLGTGDVGRTEMSDSLMKVPFICIFSRLASITSSIRRLHWGSCLNICMCVVCPALCGALQTELRLKSEMWTMQFCWAWTAPESLMLAISERYIIGLQTCIRNIGLPKKRHYAISDHTVQSHKKILKVRFHIQVKLKMERITFFVSVSSISKLIIVLLWTSLQLSHVLQIYSYDNSEPQAKTAQYQF